MLTLILASLAPTLPPHASALAAPAPLPTTWVQDEGSGDEEFDKKLAAAGSDVDALWALHEAAREEGRRDLSKVALRKIVEVSPDHEAARKALGHRRYDDQWFESYSALSKYRREEEKRKLDEEGLVRYGDGWAKEADIPYLRMGWVQDESSSRWENPGAKARAAEEARLSAEGWKKRNDLTWYSPEEAEKVDAGAWKCGEEWLDLEKANEFHGEIGTWWGEEGQQYDVYGTLPRGAQGDGRLEWARWWADQTWPDLVRALGVEPHERPSLLVLRNLEQYNLFAAGDGATLPPTEISGSSSVHYSYFAEAWVDGSTQPPSYRGQGVCYWAFEDEALAPFGQYAVRHAAAHSYMELLDPSWDTISQAFQNPANLQTAAFWGEKRIPRWLRYGIAAYCERFLKDPNATEGGDPWAIRAWALQNLRAGGDLDPLEDIFMVTLDPNDAKGSARRIFEAGLLVSFMLDGGNADVQAAHEGFKAAFAGGGDTAEAVAALQNALADNVDELKSFANF